MKALAKNGLLALGSVAIAVAAFVQAGAEAFPLQSAVSMDVRNSLTATAQADLAEKLQRAELATMGEAALTGEGLSPPSKELDARVRAAYRVNPREASVMRSVAMALVLPKDAEAGREAMRLVSDASKRDSLTDLWLALDYAKQGELEQSLSMFDYALRSSNATRQLAMIPLMSLLENPESHAPIGRLLAKQPDWAWDFWIAFSDNPIAMANAADFIKAGGVSPADTDPRLRDRLYVRLRSSGEESQLFELAMQDSQARELIEAQRAGDLSNWQEDSPFAWQVRSDGNFLASVEPKSNEIRIEAEARSLDTAGLLILPLEGEDRLFIRAEYEMPEGVSARITAQCPVESGRLQLVSLPLSSSSTSATSPVFDASACQFLDIALSFDASQANRRSTITMKKIAFLQPGEAN